MRPRTSQCAGSAGSPNGCAGLAWRCVAETICVDAFGRLAPVIAVTEAHRLSAVCSPWPPSVTMLAASAHSTTAAEHAFRNRVQVITYRSIRTQPHFFGLDVCSAFTPPCSLHAFALSVALSVLPSLQT